MRCRRAHGYGEEFNPNTKGRAPGGRQYCKRKGTTEAQKVWRSTPDKEFGLLPAHQVNPYRGKRRVMADKGSVVKEKRYKKKGTWVEPSI